MKLAVRSAIAVLAATALWAAVPASAATDTQPPTAPSSLRVLDVGPDTVTVAFTGSTDDVGLKWYVLSGAGRTQATTSPSSTVFGGLRSETTYSLTVQAVDRAGNVSAPSAPVTFTTESWPAVPGLRVVSVAGGDVTLAWGRPPGMDPYRYLVFDDGQPEALAKAEQVLMKGLAAGTHRFTVRGFHVTGSLTPVGTTVTFNVAPRGTDRAAPSAPGSVTVQSHPAEEDVLVTTWTASTDPFDPPSSLRYDLLQRWAGGLFTLKYGAVGTRFESIQLVDGVRAVDPAGNRSPVAVATFVG